jgi:hypothetical protein
MDCHGIIWLRINLMAAIVVPAPARTLFVPKIVGTGVEKGKPAIKAGMVINPPPPTTASKKAAAKEAKQRRPRVQKDSSTKILGVRFRF